MKVNIVELTGFFHATVSGRVDAMTATDFEKEIKAIVDQGAKVILMDMNELEYINSAGIRSILLLAKNIRASKGKLCFTSMQPSVEEVFDISGFKSMFTIYSTKEDAIQAGSANWR